MIRGVARHRRQAKCVHFEKFSLRANYPVLNTRAVQSTKAIHKPPVQLMLELHTWGGKREGAGCKLMLARPSVPHEKRPPVPTRNPVLITLRVREDVPSLRTRAPWAAIVRTFRAFRGRRALSFVHYSVMGNHMHAIGECEGEKELARGMQAFSARLGKALNRCFTRTGPVFASRYHARELASPTEVRNALRYVLLNARHHAHDAGVALPEDWIDRQSTAAIFDGWSAPPQLCQRDADYGTSPARSWLLTVGWRELGLLDIREVPGRTMPRAANRGPAGPTRSSGAIARCVRIRSMKRVSTTTLAWCS
jgi:putative transposase